MPLRFETACSERGSEDLALSALHRPARLRARKQGSAGCVHRVPVRVLGSGTRCDGGALIAAQRCRHRRTRAHAAQLLAKRSWGKLSLVYERAVAALGPCEAHCICRECSRRRQCGTRGEKQRGLR